MKVFHLGINVHVSGHGEGAELMPIVRGAVLELVNRMSFQNGTIGTGRVLSNTVDAEGTSVTIDLVEQHAGGDEPAPDASNNPKETQ